MIGGRLTAGPVEGEDQLINVVKADEFVVYGLHDKHRPSGVDLSQLGGMKMWRTSGGSHSSSADMSMYDPMSVLRNRRHCRCCCH